MNADAGEPSAASDASRKSSRIAWRWAHRRGIARTLNKGYWSGRYRDAYVETRAPGRVGYFLARWACGEWDFRVVEVQRVAFARWRYRLALRSSTQATTRRWAGDERV